MTVTGSSTEGVKTVLHPVSDLTAAKAVYVALLSVAPPRFGRLRRLRRAGPTHRAGAGRRAAGDDLSGGLLARVGHRGEARRATAAAATVTEPVRDVGGGRLVATISDPDGNLLGLLQDRKEVRNG